MSKKNIYTCNICGEKTMPMDLFGVCFSGMENFTLGGYGSTDGIHICKRCAKQLKMHLNSIPISEELEGGGDA